MKRLITSIFLCLTFVGSNTYAASCTVPSFIGINENFAFRALFDTRKGLTPAIFYPLTVYDNSCWIEAAVSVSGQKSITLLNLSSLRFMTKEPASKDEIQKFIAEARAQSARKK
jgi:hypothetical protein